MLRVHSPGRDAQDATHFSGCHAPSRTPRPGCHAPWIHDATHPPGCHAPIPPWLPRSRPWLPSAQLWKPRGVRRFHFQGFIIDSPRFLQEFQERPATSGAQHVHRRAAAARRSEEAGRKRESQTRPPAPLRAAPRTHPARRLDTGAGAARRRPASTGLPYAHTPYPSARAAVAAAQGGARTCLDRRARGAGAAAARRRRVRRAISASFSHRACLGISSAGCNGLRCPGTSLF